MEGNGTKNNSIVLGPGPEKDSGETIFKHVINILRWAVHFLTARGSCCRFVPCCSAYAKEAYESLNAFKATALVAKRILRCHPLSKGGYDPVHGRINGH